MLAFESDRVIHLNRHEYRRLHRKPLCRCYSSLRQYFALGVIASRDAVVEAN